jgi:PDZ domain-containing secreted protein
MNQDDAEGYGDYEHEKRRDSMMDGADNTAKLETLKKQYRDLEQELNGAYAGMSNADTNDIEDEMERLADQIHNMGGMVDTIDTPDYSRMAKLAGVQYSAPRPVSEKDLN